MRSADADELSSQRATKGRVMSHFDNERPRPTLVDASIPLDKQDDTDKDLTPVEISASVSEVEEFDYPEGGLRAWLAVFGVRHLLFPYVKR